MKRFLALVMAVAMLIVMLPQTALAAKQMEDGVPVWNEETVRQYVLDYVEGKSMERLYGYYDLQIRRYMPNETFESLLVDWYWMTGDFLGLGSYRSFSEPEQKLKTHVIHLCMEKQDLELYFTHKDKEDDWEIMATEFVPAKEETPVESTSDSMLVVGEEEALDYVEQGISIGKAPYFLEGILTLPKAASASAPVPACVLVHDDDALDKDMTIGKTAMFKDLARQLAQMDIATIRYDKRTFTYADAEIETVYDDVINDALAAIDLLQQDPRIDSEKIVVLGVGFGAILTPRIASEAGNQVAGMILIGATTEDYLNVTYKRNSDSVAALPSDEAETVKNAVRKMSSMKEAAAREVTLFGRNGYYYWELLKNPPAALIKKLRIPTFMLQGRDDPYVDEDKHGVHALRQSVGVLKALYTYKVIRGLNHLLMDDLTLNAKGECEYAIETHLDRYAGQLIVEWISQLGTEAKK